MTTKSPNLPGLGYEVTQCVLSLSVTDLQSRTIHGTMGMLLRKSQSTGVDAMEDVAGEDSNKLRLNCRNLNIESIRANGIECKFRLLDYLKRLAGKTCRELHSLSACLTGDLVAAGEGELEITLPHHSPPESLSLEIEYSCNQGVAIFCLKEEKEESDMESHMYTNVGFSYSSDLGGGCGARCLFPCVDATRSRFPLRMFIETCRNHVAIAPGKLVKTFASSPATHIFEFDHSSPIAPYAVGIAVGPFVRIAHPDYPWFSSFALASRASRYGELSRRLKPCITSMLEYLAQGKNPPKIYSQVFVAGEFASDDILPYSTMSILSDDLVFERDVEWVSFSSECESLLAQCIGLSCQWFGCGSEIGASTTADVWLPMGLAIFVSLQAVKISMGDASFYNFISKWTSRVSTAHARAAIVAAYHTKPGLVLGRSLSCPNPHALPVDAALWAARGCSFDSSFACKAGLTMLMLEQRASPMVFRDILERLARASRGTVKVGKDGARSKPKMLAEFAFLTLLKSRAGAQAHDVNTSFVIQWLRHSYVPKFTGEVSYNQKDNRVEILLKQQPQEGGRIYMGAVKIRVVEGSGTWEYEKQIDNVEHRWIFECRTTKRKGKGGRKTRAEEERTEQWRNPESLNASKLLSLAATKTSKRYWDLSSPVRYVLLDPDFAWTMDLTWKQPEEFWLEMLHDGSLKDNTALQRFAIQQLAKHSFSKESGSHLRAASAIAAIVADNSKDDTVRVDAVYALLRLHEKYAPPSVNVSGGGSGTWMGMNLILSVFKQLYCEESGSPLPFSPKNGGYSVRAALLDVISSIRAKDGGVPDEVKEVIFDSIRLCDNANNPYDDGPLLASLAVAAGKLLAGMKKDEGAFPTLSSSSSPTPMTPSSATGLDTEQDDVSEAVRWIRSALDFDSVSPSPRNRKQTTIGCLKALCEMEIAGVNKVGSTNFASYMEHTFWRKDSRVRITAFECIVKLHVIERASKGAKWMHTVHWLLRACATDPCSATRSSMMNLLLKAHADTIETAWPELQGNKSPAGCFWPLLNHASDMLPDELAGVRAIADALWDLINDKSAFNCGLRVLSHQLWRVIWKLDDVPALEGLAYAPEDLGHLEKWAEEAEQEFMRDEKQIIHIEEVHKIQARQKEIVMEEEAKRQRTSEEQANKEADDEGAAGGATPSGDDAIVAEGDEEEVIEEEEEEVIMSEGGDSNPAKDGEASNSAVAAPENEGEKSPEGAVDDVEELFQLE